MEFKRGDIVRVESNRHVGTGIVSNSGINVFSNDFINLVVFKGSVSYDDQVFTRGMEATLLKEEIKNCEVIIKHDVDFDIVDPEYRRSNGLVYDVSYRKGRLIKGGINTVGGVLDTLHGVGVRALDKVEVESFSISNRHRLWVETTDADWWVYGIHADMTDEHKAMFEKTPFGKAFDKEYGFYEDFSLSQQSLNT